MKKIEHTLDEGSSLMETYCEIKTFLVKKTLNQKNHVLSDVEYFEAKGH